jgi:hypothetical protein
MLETITGKFFVGMCMELIPNQSYQPSEAKLVKQSVISSVCKKLKGKILIKTILDNSVHQLLIASNLYHLLVTRVGQLLSG